jgi:hypothetical protein
MKFLFATATALTFAGSALAYQTTHNDMSVVPADRVVEPSNADPERDARGIRVISASAVVPPGYNGVPAAPAMGGPLEGADSGYPACTATVTDNCIQLYERGVRASAATHTGVGGPIRVEDEAGDNTAEDDALDIDTNAKGNLDVDGDLDGDGDNDLE